MSRNAQEALSSIGAMVREADPLRFYGALAAPAEARESLFALLAFNHEVARVREVISERIIGEMRLAWWHEVLDEIEAGGPVRHHAVAEGLGAAHARRPLALDRLRSLIDARAFDLYDDPMADLPALVAYADATGGGLHAAMAESLGADVRGVSAAHEAGTAWALTGIIRALNIHTARRQVFLPERELRARGATPESICKGEMSPAVEAVVAEIAMNARAYFQRARSHQNRDILPALAPCALLPGYWRRIARRGFDPFQDKCDVPRLLELTTIGLATLRGRI
jgi:phytoene/squalene synthetase